MKLRHYFAVEHLSAVLTWLLVGIVALWLMAINGFKTSALMLVSVLLLLYIITWLAATTDYKYRRDPLVRIVLIMLQALLIGAIYLQVPLSFVAILATIWAAQLPYFMSLRAALALAFLASLPFALIYHWQWQQDVWIAALLFSTFNGFAVTTMSSRLREERTAAELRAAQADLASSHRQQERLRIARNLHDTLGHHLTVLNIQLQLAQAKAELGDTPAALQSLAEARHLGKLLIADVRETVSEMREIDPADLATLLQMTLNQTTNLQASLVIEPTPSALTELSPGLSHTLLQIVREAYTNTLKHARATLFEVTLTVDSQRLRIKISDNGETCDHPWSSGHGIHGIKERVAQLGGQFKLTTTNGFQYDIEVPK